MRKNQKKFGFAFGELIEVGRFKKAQLGADKIKSAENWGSDVSKGSPSLPPSPWRLVIVYVGFIALFLVIVTRAFDLQVIKGHEFLNQAEGNRIQLLVDHAPRGVVFDRNGQILAQNIPSARLVYDPLVLSEEDQKEVFGKLAKILGEKRETLDQKIKNKGDKPITIVESLPAEKISVIEAESKNLPGITLEIRPVRYYPFKEVAAHILGYTLEADKDDLKKETAVPYSLGDQVGKAGVESSKEVFLRGVNGYKLVSISASGEKTGEIYESNAIEGRDVTLSIDVDLQKFVYQLLKEATKKAGAEAGSAVVLDPNTGEILALVSIPSYDNNQFAKGIDESTYKSLISNRYRPLIDRTIGAAYPPGSTFKLVSATAGLESGTINPQTKIEDPGYIVLGDQTFKNWLWIDQKKTEGSINVVRAIARSTDTFFYKLGMMMGEKELQKYAQIFGLGSLTGVELPGETAGLVPTNEWKLKTKEEPWYPGETLNMSIGQGDLLVSPLQLSVVSATFANGGRLVKPTIFKTDEPQISKENFLKDQTLQTVGEGMYRNTVGDGNVGWLFKDTKYKSAGKTGTAESGKDMPHAWYTGYAPYSPRGEAGPKGEIVATVMVEHAGHGSEVSAPMVKKIFNWWFARHHDK